MMLARVHVFAPQFAVLDRVSNTLSSEQLAHILQLLSAHSITYVTIGGPADRLENYDAVLEILDDGTWKWQSTSSERRGD